MSNKGLLYLIPSTLGEGGETFDVLPQKVKNVVNQTSHYIVENEKAARRFLKKVGLETPISEIQLYPLNKHTDSAVVTEYLKPATDGCNIGVISDAGCPGVADPGAVIVNLAHQQDIKVIPLVGPSSIILALMASGFNGQQFAFNGYLPKERGERIRKIKELEKLAQTKKQTQLFIETPYRNMHVMEDIINTCSKNTKLCVACNITLPSEFIKTKAIGNWKNAIPDLHKKPCIFLIY